MSDARDLDLNQEAYRKLKPTIRQTYPLGRFVAIHQGRVAADAESFFGLRDALKQLGIHPHEALIVQAGVSYPEHVNIYR